jgi:hypothetical protein
VHEQVDPATRRADNVLFLAAAVFVKRRFNLDIDEKPTPSSLFGWVSLSYLNTDEATQRRVFGVPLQAARAAPSDCQTAMAASGTKFR